jgi:hypothetical protein
MHAANEATGGSVRDQDPADVHHDRAQSGLLAGWTSAEARLGCVSMTIVRSCWSIATPGVLDPGARAPDGVNDLWIRPLMMDDHRPSSTPRPTWRRIAADRQEHRWT